MEAKGGGERTGPSVAAAELKTAAETEPDKLEPVARSRWVRDIGNYARRETSELQAARYG